MSTSEQAGDREVVEFLRGRRRRLRLEGPGAQVRVRRTAEGRVRVDWMGPPRRTAELGPDTPGTRERAVHTARRVVAEARLGAPGPGSP